MSTQLIELKGGIFVEVESTKSGPVPIAGGLAEKVSNTFEGAIKPLMLKIANSLSGIWKDINQDVDIETAEVELGIGFEVEGNVYVAKSNSSAAFKIKLILKPNK